MTVGGDAEDLKWLIAREIPHLRRYACFLVGDRARADDLVQDCLERALRKRHLWKRHGTLRSWLFRLLYRLHIDAGRSLSRRRTATDAAADAQVSVQWPDQEPSLQVGDVAFALRRLPEDQQAAILLIGVEGFSYEEAARVLDIPIGTLRSRLSRGRDALRAHWSPELEESDRPALRRVK
ncbi:MAG: sigma-70 family RNA polymerase sigma factor [Tistlia sp.]